MNTPSDHTLSTLLEHTFSSMSACLANTHTLTLHVCMYVCMYESAHTPWPLVWLLDRDYEAHTASSRGEHVRTLRDAQVPVDHPGAGQQRRAASLHGTSGGDPHPTTPTPPLSLNSLCIHRMYPP